MNILLMGPAGSGKGTMSKMIVDQFNIYHISTGDMLRKAIDSNSSISKDIKDIMDKGLLVSDDIINSIVEDNLLKMELPNGFLTDGYPRSLKQALDFDNILKKMNTKIDIVLNLVIDYDDLVDRVTGRRLCRNCGMIYHITNIPSKVDGICDKCNHKLIQRSDDTPKQLKIRILEHHKNTDPVLEHYRKFKLVYDIDATGDTSIVYNRILDVLKDYQ